jgi:hypothetical protein
MFLHVFSRFYMFLHDFHIKVFYGFNVQDVQLFYVLSLFHGLPYYMFFLLFHVLTFFHVLKNRFFSF